MQRETGNKSYPIWLLGDSEPINWRQVLDTPFDSRHPIRHNIWTSVLDIIQDKVFRETRRRIDTPPIYVRNAVSSVNDKPKSSLKDWENETLAEEKFFADMLNEQKPVIVLSFGAFAFEFCRRALNEHPARNYGYWGAKNLGDEFRDRINNFRIDTVNVLPLLHRSIAGGNFIQGHEYFCGQQKANYFEYVGNRIAEKIIESTDKLSIWI